MDYRHHPNQYPLLFIYNSRNFKWTIDCYINMFRECIYNSRNFKWTIDGFLDTKTDNGSTIVEILNGL